ncbi:eight-cysteine-cluster domain-containing protein [Candidatus Micrarchaeota archaeon]|nr:eight-cysteine-cluster domain-containing protein [Candidatus Micrarchaeota archaeon]
MKKILLLVLMISIVLFGCIETNENLKKEELILTSLDKQLTLPETYQISYSEKVQGTTLDIFLLKGETEVVITKSEVDTKWVYLNKENTTFCEQMYDEDILCADIINDSRFDAEINDAKTKFINNKLTNEAKNTFNVLIDTKSLDFKGDILERNFAERTCNQIEFQINYQDLSAANLAKIGISSSNPLVNKYKNFTQTVCYDDEFGIPLYIKITYFDSGKETVFERTALSFSDNPPELKLPGEKVNINEFYSYFSDARRELNALVYCINQEENDGCFKQISYELESSKMCEYIKEETKKYQCLIIALNFDKNPNICNLIKSQEDKDACYFELTRNTGNKTYCDYIVDNTIENMCLDLNINIPIEIKECEQDSDCSIQGCNTEICAPIEKEITTNCQWKEIYSCYTENTTSCRCINGKCSWELTNKLIDCINEYETKRILEDIKNKKNEQETNQTDIEIEK